MCSLPGFCRTLMYPLQELYKGLCDLLEFEDLDAIEEMYQRNFTVESDAYGAQVCRKGRNVVPSHQFFSECWISHSAGDMGCNEEEEVLVMSDIQLPCWLGRCRKCVLLDFQSQHGPATIHTRLPRTHLPPTPHHPQQHHVRTPHKMLNSTCQ